MSIRQVVRCVAHTKSGKQCSRRTAKTELCYQHLDSKYHLKIKASHIKAAGQGLYTTIARKKDSNLAPYSGAHVQTQDKDFGGDYVLQIRKHPPTFIDARESTAGAGRFSNNARRSHGQGSNNAKLSYNTNNKRASIKATVNIAKGKEIFTAYGNSYWNQKGTADDAHPH